jgi:glyceraldehyde-3-phosphate dehydrogenase (NADP+)
MFLAGDWCNASDGKTSDVTNPFDGSHIDTVPTATADDAERALAAAVEGARTMRDTSGYQRFEILSRASQLLRQHAEDLATTITREEGKPLTEARFEVNRSAETLQLAAEEAKRLTGEVLPLDGCSYGGTRLGFTVRVPCGVVVAITPFNFPLNLVCHKVGPALAAGNAVILKPASATPLTALEFVRLLIEAGVPSLGLQCITGSGGALGKQLVSDGRVRKVSFTGSRDVGETICHAAGIKRVTMELGSNSPLIVLDDANLEKVVAATVATGFGNAGQVCISTQRVVATGKVYGDLLDALKPRIDAIVTGNPLDERTQMGPMVSAKEAARVQQWITQATAQGARVVAGGTHDGALHQPTLLFDVDPAMRISCDELFGPAVGVHKANNAEHALALAADTQYGLSAGIFTQDIDRALAFIRQVDAGNLHINWGPGWRADLMPYGGLKDSGLGREGPKYAIEEMTEHKTVVIHG